MSRTSGTGMRRVTVRVGDGIGVTVGVGVGDGVAAGASNSTSSTAKWFVIAVREAKATWPVRMLALLVFTSGGKRMGWGLALGLIVVRAVAT